MTILEAVILGLVQGVTEFLPISSTAHLRIVPALLGWDDAGAGFTAVLQLGTLLAVVAFFARDLAEMARAAFAAVRDPASRRSPAVRLLLCVVIGTVPVVVAGVLLKDAIHGVFRTLPVIAAALIAVAVALAFVERNARHHRVLADLTLRDAVLVGCAQALALIPGVSRSGITLLAALMVGFNREAAARFSFLLSIPAIAGAGIFEMKHVLRSQAAGLPLVVGLVTCAIVGYASIAWLLRFLRTRTTLPFVVYRIALGVLIFAVLAAGWLSPSA